MDDTRRGPEEGDEVELEPMVSHDDEDTEDGDDDEDETQAD